MKVVHINHMLRVEADEDAAFVAEMCDKHEVEYKIYKEDIGKLAKERGISTEEAGRDYRYKCFRENLSNIESGKIAVAHHQNDRAETLLFNLFRGSGLKGLTAIRPIRDNIIRPLLCLTRREIEEYLETENIPYCTDLTNTEDLYSRNRIRNHIMPFAAEMNPEAVRHMAKTADLVWEAESFLHKHTELAFDECVTSLSGQKKDKSFKINLVKLNKQDIIIKKRIMLMAVEKLLPGRANISGTHVENLTALTITGGNAKINLPNGLIAVKEYDNLIIGFAEKELVEFKSATTIKTYEINLKEPEMNIPDLGVVTCRTFSYHKNEEIPQKMYTKWFDYDKITSCAVFRRRKAGDYLIINHKGQHKKLKNYLINEKIPKARRDKLYVLADESHIIWIPGFRISEFYKVTSETRTILETKIKFMSE